MQDIACIILTKDEELHIERCILSAQAVCRDIWVIDSYSTDATCALAKAMGANVVQHPFTNQAEQFNWAIDNLPINNQWIWRLDADEIIERPLAEMADRELPAIAEGVNGIYVNKKIIFMDHSLKHGGWYPAPQIKLIRRGFGRSEDKKMDEHLIVTSGDTVYWNADQTDWNLKPLEWWWKKHEGYAKREAYNMVHMGNLRIGKVQVMRAESEVVPRLFGTNAERKRWIKKIYARCPLYVRPIVYFVSRYILMGGWMDGFPGWYWHTRQGLKYRLLVDYELYKIRHPKKE